MLSVGAMTARYGQSQVLHDVSFGCDAGEIVCLLGRNGVGKTTTLKAIMGLVTGVGGDVRLAGHDIRGLPPHAVARSGVSYVPETRLIFPDLTVEENLSMGLWRGARRHGTRASERVFAFFPRLAGKRRQGGRTLSGGEQQMLAIGRAMMAEPKLVLVDEPTEGLAPVIVETLEDILQRIARDGTAVVLAESKLAVARLIAHRIVVMSKGVTVFGGSPAALEASSGVRRQYLEV